MPPSDSFRLDAQLAELREITIGALAFGLGALAFGLGALAFGLELIHELTVGQEWIAVGPDDRQVIRALARLEPDLQSWADEARHPAYPFEPRPRPEPTVQEAMIGVVKVV